MTTETVEKISLEELKTWLWGSANIMRGTVDSSDFKNYIFGLLFLKRLSDVFDERVEAVMEEEGCSSEEAMALIQEDNPEQFVPVYARWNKLIERTENIGEYIDEAFAEIEHQNPSLEKVLTAIQFGDKEKLSNELLTRLLRHFNQHKLGNKNLYKADLLGDAYEYLIGKFADDAGKKGGEFYTPHEVVELIVKLIDPQPGHEIYDLTCGCGGMLVESARHIKENYENGTIMGKPNCKLYGQEKNLGTWAIAKLNMFLHNLDGDIKRGDTLVNPLHKDGEGLQTFDRVIANPPFSQSKWWELLELNGGKIIGKNGKERNVKYSTDLKDPFGRFSLGVAPRKYADFAFIQHMIASTKDNGRVGVVVPHGVLFRDKDEHKIRKGLVVGNEEVKGDLIEGVVGLPPALFFNTGIAAAVLIINKDKPAALKNKVIFVDASAEFGEGKAMNYLREGDIKRITTEYSKAKQTLIDAGEQTEDKLSELLDSVAVDRYLRVVDTAEIKQNDFSLNISRYIDTSVDEEVIEPSLVLKNLQAIESELAECEIQLSRYLKNLGIEVTNND
ncbi:TPA: N-6 DNA methylase [Vibrio vulnificus]|uniref:type I restriction-modification system subunit M n=1 Tax=Vibrio TaxID=662 RepID=UPI0011238C18|nr:MULTISPECIES: class I SAM-dependent DNA methyltransferase [Vibrio]MBY7803088.1 type I restriction-modification system subunit M [Vibrio fluvialis]MBE3800279.1 SAM-dependent DNA methyltransferase [Vibrio parahaemolyticus]MBE3983949.1 SAM-dependent DNA methyltransferase [Vibrio parahaemolyticus]MCA0785246.1 type I restriction-modification system subunit M [Vibrio vulnificus]TOP14374.1 type I restriction endonuclease subunit M [Vibrio parahaemolyticus]